MPDPTVEAARSVVEDGLAGVREAVAGATAEMLNWRPAGPDSNSAAVLAVHGLSSTRHWLSIALGVPPPDRDRPSEFRAQVSDPDELLGFVDRTSADIRRLFELPDGYEPGLLREDEGTTAAWALVHAAEHLKEHVGHLQLTRQLWQERSAPTT